MKSLGRVTGVGLLGIALLATAACGHLGTSAQAFVGGQNGASRMVLTSEGGVKVALIGVFHGTTIGRYTMSATTRGTESGEYTYAYDSRKQAPTYVFRPDHGERWEAVSNPDGTFAGKDGIVWRPEESGHEVKKVVTATGS